MKGILITGTTRGLGKAFFDVLRKYNVFLFCISRKILPYQKDLMNNNKNIHFSIYDLNQINLIINNDEIFKNFPFNDIKELFFINNAGVIDPINKIGDLREESILSSLNVNTIAPILLINKILKICSDLDIDFKLLNISTGAANKPYEGWAMYCSTKSAFKMFVDVLSAENKDNPKILAYNIDPGVLDTDMQQKVRTSDPENFPLHNYFVNLKLNGELAEPESAAKKIIKDFINL